VSMSTLERLFDPARGGNFEMSCEPVEKRWQVLDVGARGQDGLEGLLAERAVALALGELHESCLPVCQLSAAARASGYSTLDSAPSRSR